MNFQLIFLKYLITLLISLIGIKVSFSQVASYAFSETTGTYQAIVNNPNFNGVSGTLYGDRNPIGGQAPIKFDAPFDFCLGGETYSANSSIISVDYNGWMAFGEPAIDINTRQAPLTHINNCLSAFGAGLETTGTSSVSIRVIGNAPNRVLVIQWGQQYFGDANQNPFVTTNYWRRAAQGISNDRLHFQIRLYETTNVIEFHYLISNPRTTLNGGITSDIQVGLRGASAADYNARTKSTTGSVWNNNNNAATALPVGTSNTMNFNNERNNPNNKPTFVIPANPGSPGNTAGPGTGTIFRWEPAVLDDDGEPIAFEFDMPDEVIICDSEDLNLEIISNPPISEYSWTANSNNVSGATNGTGTIITDDLTLNSGGTGFVDYTISPVDGACISTIVRVRVNSAQTPSFNLPDEICLGQSPPTLPNTSSNGVEGTWSPSTVDNTTSGTYIFTPDNEECANMFEYELTISEDDVEPIFNDVDPICQGESLSDLPTTSNNGVSGTWSPSLNTNETTTYTFTPTSDQCASTTALDIIVEEKITPTFSIEPSCSGIEIEDLPTTSDNGITGFWTTNSAVTNYVFTPDAGQCAEEVSIPISNEDEIPDEPDPENCWDEFEYNSNNCSWENIGSQPDAPVNLTCSQTVIFNETSCEWDIVDEPLNYTVTAENPISCDDQTGVIIISGLQPTTDYIITIDNETGNNYTSNGNGEVVLSNMAPGTYNNFIVSFDGCDYPNNTSVIIEPLDAIQVNAGSDQTICEGEAIILSGSGATTYTWDNNVTNGQPFTPPVGTTTYTVTGETNGCIGTDQVTVTVQDYPSVSFEAFSESDCALSEITFVNTTSGSSSSCSWDMGDGNVLTDCDSVVYTFSETGCFDVTLTVANTGNCQNTSSVTETICLGGNPIADFMSKPLIAYSSDPTFDFINESVGATSYKWNFGDMFGSSLEENPTYTYSNDNTGFYEVMLVAFNASGCSDTIIKTVEIREELIYWIPNAFTPDDDPFNDVFQPVFASGFDPFDYNLLIFNRWGEIVFESNNAQVGWDGTYGGQKVKDGVYIWKIEFKEKYTDERHVVKGHVTLLR